MTLDDMMPTAPEMERAERSNTRVSDVLQMLAELLEEDEGDGVHLRRGVEAIVDYETPTRRLRRAGARVPLEEGLALGDREAERSPLELGAAFLGDHQVVEALAAGQEPLVTYTMLRLPSGECRVMFTGHSNDESDLRFAHVILLDALRRQIDRVDGEGAAAKAMFAMATDTLLETTETVEDGKATTVIDRQEPKR